GGPKLAHRHVLDHALAQRADGRLAHREASVLRLEVRNPSILKTERPPRHLISARAQPPQEHHLARSALPRARARSVEYGGRLVRCSDSVSFRRYLRRAPDLSRIPALDPNGLRISRLNERVPRGPMNARDTRPIADEGKTHSRYLVS